MRGSEKLAELLGWKVYHTFLIPMRGSEPLLYGYAGVQPIRFLIPMRGSEIVLTWRATSAKRSACGFLIPMRGSESLRWTLSRVASPVPDPHEG